MWHPDTANEFVSALLQGKSELIMGTMDNHGMAQGRFPEEQGRVQTGSLIPIFWGCVLPCNFHKKKFQGREKSVTFVDFAGVFFHDHKLSFLN